MYKVLDLFSGAGGFSFGLEMNKNFKTFLAVDNNEFALKTFSKNHPHTKIIFGDLTLENIKQKTVLQANKLKINMVVGGPPCQGFSMKGKKLGLKDRRNFLFLDFLEIVRRIKPKIFILENVKAIAAIKNIYFVNEIIRKFKNIGFKISYGIMNASNFGIPQNRERMVIIGSIDKEINLPALSYKKKVDIKDAISDLCFLESGENHTGPYINKPFTEYQKIMRENSKHLFNHSSTTHLQKSVVKMSMIPEKGNKFDLPKKMRTNQKFKTTWSRLHWNKLSPTIDTRFDTPSNGQNIHPILNRSITPREAARIQSFPDKFVFVGKKTHICRQIGNAVPPLMARAIADSIISQNEFYKLIEKKKHIVLNKDSLKLNPSLFPKFDAIITDPPYNISKKNNLNTLYGKRAGVFFGTWDKKFNILNWIERYFKNLKEGGTIIVFCSYLYISYIAAEIKKLGGEVKDVIKWIKSNPMPRNTTRRYVQDTEFAIWAVKPGKWTFNNFNSKYKRAQINTAIVSGKEKTIHPTQKSIKLINEIIKLHTNKNDLIIDPFMGSGTIGVSALQLGRKFIGIEILKKYFMLSKKRINRII